MRYYRSGIILIFCWGAVLTATSGHCRQNILIGEVSIRYDHQERTYDDTALITATPDGSGGEIVAEGVGGAAGGPTVIIVEDRRGDRQRFLLSPRLTYSSIGISDVIELTYAPSLNYDDIYDTTDLDHYFGLRAERNLTRNWSVEVSDSFFLGDDPVRGEELRTAVIVPETGEPVVEEPVVGAPAEESEDVLTERYGSRRYWTNSLDLSTGYDYGEDRTVRAGYVFDVLRNEDSSDVGGYTDYDRHTGRLFLDHRFTRKWRADGDLRYSRGLFDESDVLVVTPDAGTPDSEEYVEVERVTAADSDDLSEYELRARGGYDSSPHLFLFSQYRYRKTDYDADLREDYQINEIAVGFDYDITQHLHATLYGGPTWGSFENSPTETDYSAYGGVTWDYMHGALSFFVEKGYDQSNFDGRRSGLTDFWRTGMSLDYQLTQALTATVSASYRDNERLQFPAPRTVIIIDDGQAGAEAALPQESFDRVEYTEKDYDAGFSLAYTFLRWYTLSGGYRYYNHETDIADGDAGSYDEHRAFIQLSVSKELLRW